MSNISKTERLELCKEIIRTAKYLHELNGGKTIYFTSEDIDKNVSRETFRKG